MEANPQGYFADAQTEQSGRLSEGERNRGGETILENVPEVTETETRQSNGITNEKTHAQNEEGPAALPFDDDEPELTKKQAVVKALKTYWKFLWTIKVRIKQEIIISIEQLMS